MGQRFCLNSAALRFIPKEDLEKEGYREYLKLFARKSEKSVQAVRSSCSVSSRNRSGFFRACSRFKKKTT
jgi:hypothetical protein